MIDTKSLRAHEGYILVDHRESPGVPDEQMLPAGFPVGSGRGLFESATFTCPYCNAVVVLNPNRSRPRNYDAATNHLICDGCQSLKDTGVALKTMQQIADELLNTPLGDAVASGAIPPPSILLP